MVLKAFSSSVAPPFTRTVGIWRLSLLSWREPKDQMLPAFTVPLLITVSPQKYAASNGTALPPLFLGIVYVLPAPGLTTSVPTPLMLPSDRPSLPVISTVEPADSKFKPPSVMTAPLPLNLTVPEGTLTVPTVMAVSDEITVSPEANTATASPEAGSVPPVQFCGLSNLPSLALLFQLFAKSDSVYTVTSMPLALLFTPLPQPSPSARVFCSLATTA